MFGLNMSGCPVWSINTFAQAAAFFEFCPTQRGTDERKIKGKEGSKAMGVRMTHDGGAVAFRYHCTNVVVWYRDGSYNINLSYNSRSTCEFGNRFIPRGHYADKQGHRLLIDDTVYPAGCQLTVSADGVVSGMLYQFRRTTVNRKRARQILLGSNYHAYKAWRETMLPMLADSLPPLWRRQKLSNSAVVTHLQSSDLWHELMLSMDGNPENIRSHLYAQFEGYDHTTADHLPNKRVADKWNLA